MYSLNPEITDTNIELFGSKSKFTVFPRSLEILLQKLPLCKELQAQTIIEKHTLLPTFLPFLSESRTNSILKDILHRAELEEICVGKLVGSKYGKSVSEEIKYCPQCIEEDWEVYGVSYIHREHQYAFIHTCFKHSVDLITQCDDCGTELMYTPVLGSCKSGHNIKYRKNSNMNDQFEKDLHMDLKFLFSHSIEIKLWLFKQRFWEYLNAKGFLKIDGKQIRQQVFIKEFLNAFTHEQFLRMGIDINYIKKWNSIERILGYKHDPLVVNVPLSLLLIKFLAGSLERFILKPVPFVSEIPFGNGPWVCKNKNCPDYMQSTIHKCARTKNGLGGIKGQFICECCQAGYVMEWKKGSVIKRNHYRNNVFFPKAKEDQVVHLLGEGETVGRIATKLFCSVDFIRKVAKEHSKSMQFKLLSEENEIAATSEISEESQQKNQYRQTIANFMQRNPELSRNQILTKYRKEYAWLRRNDVIWFEENLPPSKSFVRFDWNEFDVTLEKKIRDSANKLIESNPNTRVGKYSIMATLSKKEVGRLKTYLQHLPKSNNALIECVETKEQYQLRHLPALVWQLKSYYNYKQITVETIQAYRRSYRGITEEFKRILSKRLTELNEY